MVISQIPKSLKTKKRNVVTWINGCWSKEAAQRKMCCFIDSKTIVLEFSNYLYQHSHHRYFIDVHVTWEGYRWFHAGKFDCSQMTRVWKIDIHDVLKSQENRERIYKYMTEKFWKWQVITNDKSTDVHVCMTVSYESRPTPRLLSNKINRISCKILHWLHYSCVNNQHTYVVFDVFKCQVIFDFVMARNWELLIH